MYIERWYIMNKQELQQRIEELRTQIDELGKKLKRARKEDVKASYIAQINEITAQIKDAQDELSMVISAEQQQIHIDENDVNNSDMPELSDENVKIGANLTKSEQDAKVLEATPFDKVLSAKTKLKDAQTKLKDLKESFSYANVDDKFQVGRLSSEDMKVFVKQMEVCKALKVKLDNASYNVLTHLSTCTLVVPKTSDLQQFREIVKLHMRSKSPYLALKMLLAFSTNAKVSREEMLKMLSPKESEKATYTEILKALSDDIETLSKGVKLIEKWNPLKNLLTSAKI